MLDGELLDVLSTHRARQAAATAPPSPTTACPFIFANFNGTQHDVEVVTHEAGHAFAAYTNRDTRPHAVRLASIYEACEVHSMSMEFFAWPWAEGFFGTRMPDKFRYTHLAGAHDLHPLRHHGGSLPAHRLRAART